MIAFTPLNITAGFQATSIHPFNRDIFTDVDFAPAAPTDLEQDEAAAGGAEGNPTPEDATLEDETPADDLSSDNVQPRQEGVESVRPSTSQEPS